MKKNLVIFGSCVSRDPLELKGLGEALLYYHCRSNIASLANENAFEGRLEIGGMPPFQRRCVTQDLEKSFRTDFENCVIVFDFIDDRFPVAIKGEGVFTRNPLAASLDPLLYRGMKLVRHFEPANWPFVEEALALFAKRFIGLTSKNVTVLHAANFSPFYDGGSPDAGYCRMMSAYYDRLFEAIRYYLHFDYVIDCMSTIKDAESTPRNHQWGHAPFHYHSPYNLCFAEEIAGILAEN